MNANQIADELENIYWVQGDVKGKPFQQYADFIRQQQAEIAELKHMNRNWQISENILLLELEKLQHCELTDEEIWELHQEHIDEVTCGHSMKTVGFIEFARAILRKASEK